MTGQKKSQTYKPNGAEELTKSLHGLTVDEPTSWESDEKLIIALDFGTTFSGIAFCFANQRDSKVAAIVDWPGGGNPRQPVERERK